MCQNLQSQLQLLHPNAQHQILHLNTSKVMRPDANAVSHGFMCREKKIIKKIHTHFRTRTFTHVTIANHPLLPPLSRNLLSRWMDETVGKKNKKRSNKEQKNKGRIKSGSRQVLAFPQTHRSPSASSHFIKSWLTQVIINPIYNHGY